MQEIFDDLRCIRNDLIHIRVMNEDKQLAFYIMDKINTRLSLIAATYDVNPKVWYPTDEHGVRLF